MACCLNAARIALTWASITVREVLILARLPIDVYKRQRKGAVKQQRVLEALRQGDLRVSELTAEYGSLSSTLSSLEKKGVIRIEQRRRLRSPEDQSEVFSARTKVKPLLTQDQHRALSVIENAAAAQAGEVVLIDGVTGSGKTEVYLCAIEQALAQGNGCLLYTSQRVLLAR